METLCSSASAHRIDMPLMLQSPTTPLRAGTKQCFRPRYSGMTPIKPTVSFSKCDYRKDDSNVVSLRTKSHPPPARVVAGRLHHLQRHFCVRNSAELSADNIQSGIGGMLRCFLDECDYLGPFKMTDFGGSIPPHSQICGTCRIRTGQPFSIWQKRASEMTDASGESSGTVQ